MIDYYVRVFDSHIKDFAISAVKSAVFYVFIMLDLQELVFNDFQYIIENNHQLCMHFQTIFSDFEQK